MIPRNPVVKAVTALVGAILLGAIGSGLWDRVLGPFVDFLSRHSVVLISSMFHGYLDSVYADVSRNPADLLTLLPFVALSVIAIGAPWVGIVVLVRSYARIQRDVENLGNRNEKELTAEGVIKEVRAKRRSILVKLIPMAILSTVLYSESMFSTAYSRKAALFLERSIEIVAPYLNERARLELRAQFRSIETASDFYQLDTRLRVIARENSAKLPKFDPVR